MDAETQVIRVGLPSVITQTQYPLDLPRPGDARSARLGCVRVRVLAFGAGCMHMYVWQPVARIQYSYLLVGRIYWWFFRLRWPPCCTPPRYASRQLDALWCPVSLPLGSRWGGSLHLPLGSLSRRLHDWGPRAVGQFAAMGGGYSNEVLPAAPLFLRAGDPLSAPSNTPSRIDLQPIPALREAAANARGVHHVTRRVSHMLAWRHFFDIYAQAPVPERMRLLSQSGPGSVSFLNPDTSLAHPVHPEVFCSSVRRAVGLSAVGPACQPLRACPTCNLTSADPVQLERHIPRGPLPHWRCAPPPARGSCPDSGFNSYRLRCYGWWYPVGARWPTSSWSYSPLWRWMGGLLQPWPAPSMRWLSRFRFR